MSDPAKPNPALPPLRSGWGIPPRLLLAEDEDDLREFLADQFRAAGFHVIEAEDGMAMLECLADASQATGQQQAFDLIVSDVRMPGFTAFQILKNARFVLRGTPVILMTAFGDRRAHQRAAVLGAAAMFDKPLEIEELLQVARRLVEKGSRHSK